MNYKTLTLSILTQLYQHNTANDGPKDMRQAILTELERRDKEVVKLEVPALQFSLIQHQIKAATGVDISQWLKQ